MEERVGYFTKYNLNQVEGGFKSVEDFEFDLELGKRLGSSVQAKCPCSAE